MHILLILFLAWLVFFVICGVTYLASPQMQKEYRASLAKPRHR